MLYDIVSLFMQSAMGRSSPDSTASPASPASRAQLPKTKFCLRKQIVFSSAASKNQVLLKKTNDFHFKNQVLLKKTNGFQLGSF